MISAYEVYHNYVAMKLHFSNEDYDFIKYHGKSGVTKASFERRKDVYQFEKAARNYGKGMIVPFLVANNLQNPDFWIGDPNADETFKIWKGRVDAINYNLGIDIDHVKDFLINRGLKFETLYDTEMGDGGKFPGLFKMHLAELLNPETSMILMHGLKLFDRWSSATFASQPMYKREELKLKKYSRFFDIPRLIKANESKIVKLFQ
jgi:hypothetical protein